MKYAAVVVLLLAAGCSSPTAPTPVPPPIVVVPPVIIPPTPPAPTLPLGDPRFDLGFYRQLAHDALESPTNPWTLQRHSEAPRIYLRTVDDAGAPIDVTTLNQTAAALERVAGTLTGVFGVAGIERGTETREGQPGGWITVRWSAVVDPTACGRAQIAGRLITLYPKTPGCRCSGGPAVGLGVVKHELGHALGFHHTDGVYDLMYRQSFAECDKNPSEREIFHARVAYSMPIGSAAP